MSTRCVEHTECLSAPSNIYYTRVALSLKYTVRWLLPGLSPRQLAGPG